MYRSLLMFTSAKREAVEIYKLRKMKKIIFLMLPLLSRQITACSFQPPSYQVVFFDLGMELLSRQCAIQTIAIAVESHLLHFPLNRSINKVSKYLRIL